MVFDEMTDVTLILCYNLYKMVLNKKPIKIKWMFNVLNFV